MEFNGFLENWYFENAIMKGGILPLKLVTQYIEDQIYQEIGLC